MFLNDRNVVLRSEHDACDVHHPGSVRFRDESCRICERDVVQCFEPHGEGSKMILSGHILYAAFPEWNDRQQDEVVIVVRSPKTLDQLVSHPDRTEVIGPDW